MGLVRTVDPTVEPVTLTEARLHLRVTDTADDTLITSLIQAAREYAESYCRRSLLTQTWKLTLDRFPYSLGGFWICDGRYYSGGHAKDYISLPRPNLLTVSSVTYVDTNGATQTWAASNYLVDTTQTPGQLRLAYNIDWPSTRTDPNAVAITYTAGYGASATAVPEAIKSAIKLMVGWWYEQREAVNVGNIVNEVPMAVDALLGPYVVREAA